MGTLTQEFETYTQFKMPVGVQTQPGQVNSLRPFGATAVRTIQVKNTIAMHLLDTFPLDDPAINVIQDRQPISKNPIVANRP